MLKVGVTFTPTMRTELLVRAKGGYVLINHTAPETNQDVTEGPIKLKATWGSV